MARNQWVIKPTGLTLMNRWREWVSLPEEGMLSMVKLFRDMGASWQGVWDAAAEIEKIIYMLCNIFFAIRVTIYLIDPN